MHEPVAIIDLGTNTFHLLIARPGPHGYEITFRERLPVKIGMGGINSGFITEEAVARALAGMKEFRKTMNDHQVTAVKALGTSALRNAKNGKEVAGKIAAETGIQVNIISGDREAEYIYRGVRWAVPLGTDKSLILDIGGGSVEFIIGNEREIFWKQSIEIGAQRLLERFQRHDPITSEEIAALDNYFASELAPVFQALKIHDPKTLVGSSGTFDTLSEVYCLRHHIPLSTMPETSLTFAGFRETYLELIARNRAQRMQIPGMIEMRVDMIVVACCLIRFLIEHHVFKAIRVSTYSLKEGALAALAEGKD